MMVWFALYTTHYEPECLNVIRRARCNDIHIPVVRVPNYFNILGIKLLMGPFTTFNGLGMDFWASEVSGYDSSTDSLTTDYYYNNPDNGFFCCNRVIPGEDGNVRIDTYAEKVAREMELYGPRGIKMFLMTFVEPEVYENVSYKKITVG